MIDRKTLMIDRIVTATLARRTTRLVVDVIVPAIGEPRFASQSPATAEHFRRSPETGRALARAAQWLITEPAATGCTLETGWVLEVRS